MRSFVLLLVCGVSVMGCARLMTLDPPSAARRNDRDWTIRNNPTARASAPTTRVAAPAVSAHRRPGVRQRLAVLEFSGTAVKDDVMGVLADAVRGGVVEGAVGSGIEVMTRENMLVLLKEMGKSGCSEGDCEVETARNIGADLVISGHLTKMDDTFVVTLKLHETKTASLLGTEMAEAKKQIELMRALKDHGRKLVAGSP